MIIGRTYHGDYFSKQYIYPTASIVFISYGKSYFVIIWKSCKLITVITIITVVVVIVVVIRIIKMNN